MTNKIKEYYAETRAGSKDGVLTCTPRLLAALIRFSEAVARAHLSDIVTADHADIAIALIDYYRGKEASIERGGIDRLQSTMVSPQRYNVSKVLQVIGELQHEVEDYKRSGVPLVEIKARCEVEGITSDSVDATMNHLQQMGEIYPCAGGFKPKFHF